MKISLYKNMEALNGRIKLCTAALALGAGLTLTGCGDADAIEPTTPVTSEVVSEEISENEVSENEVSEEEVVEEVAQYPNAPQVLELTEEEKYTYTQVSDEVAYAKIEEIKQTCLERLGYDYDTWYYLQAFLALNRNCLSDEVINELTAELDVIGDEYGYIEEICYSYFSGSRDCIALSELILDDELRHHAAIMEYFATANDLTDEEHLNFFQTYCLEGNDSYTNYCINDYENMPELRLIDVYYTRLAWHNSNTNSMQFRELCIAFDIDPDDRSCEFLYDEFQSMQK